MRTKCRLVLFGTVVVLMLLSWAGVALAWPDLGPDEWQQYGLSEEQLKAISQGYPDGTWRPYAEVTRFQATKMAVEAFNITPLDAANPSFSDVAKDDPYYRYVEAAYAAGLTRGVAPNVFGGDQTITRQQAVAMIARWVAQRDGYNLESRYPAQTVDRLLGRFSDGEQVAESIRREVALAVDFSIIFGSNGALRPAAVLNRIQYASTLTRSMGRVGDQWSWYLGSFSGTVGAEAEFAMNEAKDFSLSDVFDPKDEPVLSKIVAAKCASYGVSYYLEKDLMLTDLFADVDMGGAWVYIIYKKPNVLQAYLDLKAEEAALKASGQYDTAIAQRKSIAFRFGKLLGYTDAYLLAKLAIAGPPPVTTIDERSYWLGSFMGTVGAEAEFAMNEAKPFSLSDVFDPAEEPLLTPRVKAKCDGYGVSYYLEKDLMLTDLFADVDMGGAWVYIIYKKPNVLQAYLDLKAEEAALKASGQYDTAIAQRKSIAFRFGKLLGYTDAYLNAKLGL